MADETAILACSAYLDLNPVRARVAEAPEKNQYTSVYERVAAQKAVQKERARAKLSKRRGGRTRSAGSGEGQTSFVRRDAWLTPLTIDERSAAYKGAMPSKSGKRASDKGFLGMSFELYLKLLDWTGRQIRRDYEKGRIPTDSAPIMQRVGLSGELWCDLVTQFGKIFKRVAGKRESLAQEASLRGRTGYRTGSSRWLAILLSASMRRFVIEDAEEDVSRSALAFAVQAKRRVSVGQLSMRSNRQGRRTPIT